MRKFGASLALAIALSAYGQVPTPGMDKLLTEAAQTLANMGFDVNAPVTIRGRVSTLVWPEKSDGMLLIEGGPNGEKYAFSTARTAQMARQGFTRFSIHPGEEVIVTGILASGNKTVGPGFSAARADLITKAADGNRVFDRSRLP